jgi:hypothetical protein
MAKKGSTDWLWYGLCGTCECLPGGACLNQRDPQTATIRGQGTITRPHDNREKLAERIIPFVMPESTTADVLAWLDAHAEEGNHEWTGTTGRERAAAFGLVAHVLRQAVIETPTTRADPYWEN